MEEPQTRAGKTVTQPWWTRPMSREEFMRRADQERARIAESTHGTWVGKGPTTVTPEEP
jgi:hypothetical protein